MKCVRCSSEIPAGSKFCEVCGLKIKTLGPGGAQEVSGPAPPQQTPPAGGAGEGQPPSPGPPQQYPPVPPYGGFQYMPTEPARPPSRGGLLAWIQQRRICRSQPILIISMIYVGVFALLGTVTLGVGDFSAYEITSTMASVGVFVFAGVCGYMLLERDKYIALGTVVIIAATLSAFFAVISFLEGFGGDTTVLKVFGIISLLALFGAHSCLLLLIDCYDPPFRACMFGTVAIIWILALMIAVVIIAPESALESGGSVLLRAAGVFSILDVAGTIITLLMWRLSLASGRQPSV